MKIIDKKTGKRIVDTEVNKSLRQDDPIKRNVEKGLESVEHSPMDPPEAYDGAEVRGASYDQMDVALQQYMDEHRTCINKAERFEKAMVRFKDSGYQLNAEINRAFSEFFQFFDHNIIDHNQREEKQLFPLLHKRLMESDEHGQGSHPKTAVDMMEDDHMKFIQLGTLTFNMLGLAARLRDERSRMVVYDVAFNNGVELVELLRLHIYREDNIVFPLAHKLISKEEFAELHEVSR